MNNVQYQIQVDVSAWTAAMQAVQAGITNIQTDLSRLQQAERFTYFADSTRNFANELANTNRVVIEQRELLRQLQNYEKFLEEQRKKTNDPAVQQRYISELARTRAAMVELRAVGGAALEHLQVQNERVANSAKNVNSGYQSLTKTVAGLASAYLSLSSFTDFTKSAILAANNYEQLNIAFTTILKSKAQADDLQAKIIELAAKTPYELPQLQETAKKLLAYGFAASEIVPTLTSIGDIAAGVGLEKLPQITNALGKMHAANRMMLGDVNSLTKAGINILAELETVTGKSGAALRKYISQGNVTYQVAYDALMRIAKTDFGGLMEKQSQTVSGLFSTLKDNATQASKTIGDGINEKLKDVIRYWTDFLSRTSQDDLKKWGDRIGAVAVAISVLVANLINLAPSLIAMLAIVKLVQEWNNFDTAVKKWNETATGTKGHIAFLQSGFKGLWTTISANPIGAMITAFAMLLPVAQFVYEKLTALSEREKELNENIKSVVGSTSIQINESNKLFAIIKDGTSTKEQYSGAVKKVLELSKEHGLGIETEKQLIGDLTTAQKLLNAAIVENAIARQKAMQQQKMTDELVINQTKIAELERKQKQSGGAKQIYNAETGVTETYDPYQSEINKLEAKSKAIADKGAQTIQDIGNSTKEVTKILNASLKEPFGELNTQISVTQKQADKAASALESKRKEIETRAKGATAAQQRALANELKPFEIEAERLQNEVKKAKAELSRDKDNAVGIGKKKPIVDEIDEKAAAKSAKEAEKRENEAQRIKQQALELSIKFESDAETKKQMQAKKAFDEHTSALDKALKDKAITQSERDKYGRAAEKSYQTELSDIAKEFAEKRAKELEKIENDNIASQKRRAKLIVDDRKREIEIANVQYDESVLKARREIKNEAELSDELVSIQNDRRERVIEINRKYNQKELDEKFKTEKDNLDLGKAVFERGETENRLAFERSKPNKRERANYELLERRNRELFQLTHNKRELEIEYNHQLALSRIGIEGASARVQNLGEQIKNVNAQIKATELTPLQNKEGKKFDIWRDVFGLDSEDEKDKKRIESVKRAGNELSKLANQYLATQLKNADKNLKIHDDAVKKAEDRIKKEQELKDKGFANDLENAQKSLEKEKELQSQALKQKQDVQKQQLVLESIGQFSSLVSASANIYESMSPLGPVGIGIAVATIAAMFTSFALAKKDAYDSITKYEKGGLVRGKSHAEGGVIAELEDGERVTNKVSSARFASELEAINDNDSDLLRKLMIKRFVGIENMGKKMTNFDTVPMFQHAKVVQMFEKRDSENTEKQFLEQVKTNELLQKMITDKETVIDLGDYVLIRSQKRVERIRKAS